MRVERTGTPEKLTPRLRSFLVNSLRGEDLDRTYSDTVQRPDFSCLDNRLVVEIKSLEDDGEERLANLFAELEQREDFPHFYGTWPVGSLIGALENQDDAWKSFYDRVGRALERIIRKANKQLHAHAQRCPRKNQLRVVFLANEDVPLYAPQTVSFLVRRLLNRRLEGRLRFPDVDAVFYFTERHYVPQESGYTFPIVVIEGHGMANEPWKRELASYVLQKWSAYLGQEMNELDYEDMEFGTIEHVPERMKRGELWTLQYKRRPYMRSWSDEQVRDRFDEMMVLSCLGGLKDSPAPNRSRILGMVCELMAHMMHEQATRGLDMKTFRWERARMVAAAKRLRLPENLQKWVIERALKETAQT